MGHELQQLKEKKGKSLFEKLTPKKMSGLMDRIGVKKNNKDKDKKGDENDSKEKAKKVVKEVIITSLKGIVVFLKALTGVLSSCGALGILIVLIVFCVVVAAVAGVFSVMQEGGFLGQGADGTEGGTAGKAKTQQESSVVTDNNTVGTGQTQVFTDNSTWVNCCKSVYTWYLSNIRTYCHQVGTEPDYPSTKAGRLKYPSDLFPGTEGCGDDCSSYVSNSLVYAGFLPASSVNCFCSSDLSGWAYDKKSKSYYAVAKTKKLDAYFNQYTYADYQAGNYKPRAGDIMAFKGHVEILAEINNSPVYVYSWGKIQSENPVTSRRGNTLDAYLSTTACIWALKDNVTPPSYLKNATVTNTESKDE